MTETFLKLAVIAGIALALVGGGMYVRELQQDLTETRLALESAHDAIDR